MGVGLEQFGEQDITSLSEVIWDSILGLKVCRATRGPGDLPPSETLVGCVHITGGWEGAVTLECSISLARKVSAIMFSLNEEAATREFIEDALGELTNMTGGNIKASLLPGLSDLGLPTVESGTLYSVRIPDTRLVTRLVFTCLDEHFVVTLLEKTSQPSDSPVIN